MKETAARSHNKQTQDEAWLYTITCTYNNHYDWRFPTIYEFIYSGLFTNLDVWNIENVNNPHLNTVKAKYLTLPIRDIKKATQP
jgi:hypothetical protein